MDLDVRPLQPDDRTAWDPLWQGYLAFYRTDLAPEVTEVTWGRFHDPDEPVHGLGAFDAGRLVGIAHLVFHRSTWSTEPYAYLSDLFTAPAARGRGVGRALMAACVDAAHAAGAATLYWQTHTTNATARSLYDQVAHHDGFLVYEADL